MIKTNAKTCRLCQGVYRHPVFMITPSPGIAFNNGHPNGQKLLLAAQMKCTCSQGIHPEYSWNGADLSDMTEQLRGVIFAKLEQDHKSIPVIDPDDINKSDHLDFVVDFDKALFKNWLAIDLISVDMFNEYIEQNKIKVDRVTIPK